MCIRDRYPAAQPSHHLVFAEILLAHIDDVVLADPRHVDPLKLDLVGRLGGTGYATKNNDSYAFGTPTSAGVLTTQRSWLRYRDAWVCLLYTSRCV